jgi:hypothetical protein
MSAQLSQLMRILGAWQAIATPPNITSSFKQTGLHSSWNPEYHTLVVSVNLAIAPKLMSERANGRGLSAPAASKKNQTLIESSS